MFKRLAPVIELSESCSESNSPAHKRSQTQHKTRFVSPSHSDMQVWQIIQSRRNLDKKIRLVKSRVVISVEKNRKNCISPTDSTFSSSVEKKKVISKGKIGKDFKENRENKENKEKIAKKVEQARNEVKLQYAIDLEFIKKRNEIIFQQKREKVLGIKNSLAAGKHKRTTSGQVLREVSSSENVVRNRNSKKILNQTVVTKVRSHSMLCGIPQSRNSNRSLSVLVSPRNLY
jgi:hypothetical protein